MATAAASLPSGSQQNPALNYVETGWRLVAIALACLISVFLDQATAGMVGGVDSYMVGSLSASYDEGLWLLIGYGTAYYLSLICSPFMIGKFSRRNVWVYGHVIYAIASFMIAADHNFWGVVFWRVIQGLGQGTFFVCAVMTILRIFPPKIAFLGFALFASMSLAGASMGPAIGGWFSDINAWPLMFVVLGVLALTAATLVGNFLHDPPSEYQPSARFDFLGIFLALIHYFTYNYVTIEGETRDWFGNPQVTFLLVLFFIATTAFIVWELRTPYPFIKMRLFAVHNLRYGAMLGFVLGVPLFGANVFNQYLQNGIDFTPGLAGAEVALRAVTVVLVVPFVAYSLSKQLIDSRYFIVTGFILVSTSYWILYFESTFLSDFGTFVVPILIQGVGFALLFSPVARAVLSSLAPADFTRGVAIFKLTLVTGGSFASAALGVIYDHRYAIHSAEVMAGINLAIPAAFTLLHPGAPSTLSTVAQVAGRQTGILASADCIQYIAILALLAAPGALILRPPPKPK